MRLGKAFELVGVLWGISSSIQAMFEDKINLMGKGGHWRSRVEKLGARLV